MSILEVVNMTQGFGDREIFNNVSFSLEKGEHIGLTGPNGQGKTTFMRLITNEILPESGKINWNRKYTVGYMDQNVKLKKEDTVRDYLRTAFIGLYDIESKLNKLYEKMQKLEGEELGDALKKTGVYQDILEESDFYSIESKIDGVSQGIGIRHLLKSSTYNLSGGQRSKILLAKLLLERPDILLLDEPTNHLDEENIEWLKSYLIDYPNAFICISHDKSFLNSVINVVYNLENKKLARYPGNLDKFDKLYEERKNQLKLDYLKQQKRIEKLEDYIQKNKVRASTAKMAASRQKELDKIDRIVVSKENPKPHFNFLEGRSSGSLIFETHDLVIGYDKPLTSKLNLRMERDDKIAIIGANGIGKTTLLKSLMGMINPISGSVELGLFQIIGYFEQEIKSQSKLKAIDDVANEFPKYTKTEIRRILARCGLTNKHIDSSLNTLSGGEAAKVRLCKVMNKKSNILFLDEPTNHLDQAAKDELKRALIDYNGSAVIVSHEVEFYKGIVNKIWNCEDWTLKMV